jgi:hypothetical protein
MKPPPLPAVGRRTQADAAVESFIRAHRDGQVPDELLAPPTGVDGARIVSDKLSGSAKSIRPGLAAMAHLRSRR